MNRWVNRNHCRAKALVFTEHHWDAAAKEAHFTQPLAKSHALDIEARDAGDQHVVDASGKLTAAMTVAKNFLHGYRAMQRM